MENYYVSNSTTLACMTQHTILLYNIHHLPQRNSKQIDIDKVLANGINVVAQQIDTYRMVGGRCIILHNIQQLESTT